MNQGFQATKKNLGLILEKLLGSLSSLRIIVNGLDECPIDDLQEIIDDLLKLRGAVPGACKVLMASRDMRSISKLLQRQSKVELSKYTQCINDDIVTFFNPQLEALAKHLDQNTVDQLRNQIISKAKGEFMWANPHAIIDP